MESGLLFLDKNMAYQILWPVNSRREKGVPRDLS